MSTILYDIGVEGDYYGFKIDWGNEPGWSERYKKELNNATKITLVPKENVTNLPIIIVDLTGKGLKKKWIVFSRVVGKFSTSGHLQKRYYAIGYQRGRTKVITWVHPNGVIEVAENPTIK